jgi:dTDP-4-amino-4,6-dideoxygalactose transaminase
MKNSILAIHGGLPVRSKPFPSYCSIGYEEKQAVMEVMDSGVLSSFLGCWQKEFFGGYRVQKLEREWEEYFNIQHAVSFNSATSGIYAAVGASGVGPGDEVIVSPYTMSASAVAAVVYGAIPVFADIDPRTFCITADSIRKVISPRTKVIIAVDIFGHPADFDSIMTLAQQHGIFVIEDAAQAPGSYYRGRRGGCLADIGIFSLNYHKTIHSGEGGVAVTNKPDLADRLQLIRNHAEVVIQQRGPQENIVNMIGQNYRMTEIVAAIASEQLKKLDRLVLARVEAAEYLSSQLAGLDGLEVPYVNPDVRHGWYFYVMKYDEAITGFSRDLFVVALQAEGMPISGGYVQPLYLQPMYQRRIGFGDKGFPWTYSGYSGNVSYNRGICPVTERMHFSQVLVTDICHANITRSDLDDFATAIKKVLANHPIG